MGTTNWPPGMPGIEGMLGRPGSPGSLGSPALQRASARVGSPTKKQGGGRYVSY